jgi:diguanylate cyclase (GGDEF)-like protein
MVEQSAAPAGSVMVIENDNAITTAVSEALVSAHFRVVAAPSARSAFPLIFKSPPEAIILDINLPDLDGFHLAKELKRNMMLRHIPVILLTSGMDFLDKMRSLEVIVDEYIVKPVDLKDLVLRTQLAIQRSQSNLDANPLTRLPGNIAIVKTLKSRIGAGKPYAVGYADLNNFKAYNDKYGFSNGDKVIRFAAQVIVAAANKLSPQDNFVGHVGGDDFIFVCGYDNANEICQMITESFDREVPKFYNEEDRKKGFIVVEDRRGIVSQFPPVSIAVGMVSDEGDKFQNLGQINHSLTQLKKYAKSFQGSAYVRDRRSLAAQLAEFTWGPGSSAGSSKVLDNIASALGTYLPTQLTDIIKNQTITVLFQPIIDMRNDEVIGHESLVRGPSGTPLEFPDALFQTARTNNQVIDLDILCMKRVLAASQEFHKGMKLFINIFPETLLEESRLHNEILADERAKDADMIFELAGSSRSNDAGNLYKTLQRLKDRGLKICLDASVALEGNGLRLLPELKPEYIKLNMMQYKEMFNDFQKQDEFFRTVQLVKQTGSEVICTKLESRADSFLAMRAGVALGQGFLFARPAMVPQKIAP